MTNIFMKKDEKFERLRLNLVQNCDDENTKFILNHFSHNGGDAVYDDFSPIAEKNGFIASFEGFEIEI